MAVIGAGAAAAVVLANTVFASAVLDGRALERDVTQVLVKDYGQPQPKDMECPPSLDVEVGATVHCSLTTQAGLVRTVPIKITSADGHYRVGIPGRSEL